MVLVSLGMVLQYFIDILNRVHAHPLKLNAYFVVDMSLTYNITVKNFIISITMRF